MVIHGSDAIAMFLAVALAALARRRRPRLAEDDVVPVASGLVAGESSRGIVIAMLTVAGVLSKQPAGSGCPRHRGGLGRRGSRGGQRRHGPCPWFGAPSLVRASIGPGVKLR